MGVVAAHASLRAYLQRGDKKPASLSASAHRHFLPSFKALSGKKELAKHSMPRLAASIIPRKRRETRLCAVGETNGEHAPIPSSTKKHSNCSKTPRLFCLISKTK